MADLFVVGLSWRTAPVAVREQLAFRSEEVPVLVERLRQRAPIAEAMLISTCNRVEVYGVTRTSALEAARQTREILLGERGASAVPAADVAQALYQVVGDDAARHVFRVAAALDSMVLGEAQILGQLKEAYAIAAQVGASGSVLSRWMERAFGAAKRVRSETAIARGSANVSTVSVDLAVRVFGELQGACVLLVGAGKMSRLAARHLRAAGVKQILVTNRSPARAEALAREVDGEARPFEQLERLLAESDVVISSTGARAPVLTLPMMKKVVKARRWRPMVIIDIAVPRDADPDVGDLEGVYLFHIDDLESVVAANLSERRRAAEDGERIVAIEVRHFLQWLRSQRVVPTIRALRARFADVADAEVARTVQQLARRAHSAEEQEEAIRRLGNLIVAKLLHQPQMALKESPDEIMDARVEAVSALFGLTASASDSEEISGQGGAASGGVAGSNASPDPEAADVERASNVVALPRHPSKRTAPT